VCMLRRMPRLRVYVPDDLYEEIKARKLPASQLLQEAVRAELRRLDLGAAADRYIVDLGRQVGDPDAETLARASAIGRRIARRGKRRAG
jgi:hypothetical protein